MNPLADHFGEHLHELRHRVAVSLGAILLFSVISYFFSEHIADFLMAPLFQAYPDLGGLVYTNLTEAFISYLKISFFVGLMAAFPVVLFQTWMFIVPGLKKDEKKVARQIVFWATLLFTGGVAFAFLVVMPKALTFLLSFADQDLEALPKLDSYLSFVVRSSVAFGLSFEIPLLMVMAGKAGFVQRQYFVKQRKYFYLAILVLSFLLAAGDFLSMILLAFPLFILYEAGLFVMLLFRSPA